jgi:hypothetical protein
MGRSAYANPNRPKRMLIAITTESADQATMAPRPRSTVAPVLAGGDRRAKRGGRPASIGRHTQPTNQTPSGLTPRLPATRSETDYGGRRGWATIAFACEMVIAIPGLRVTPFESFQTLQTLQSLKLAANVAGRSSVQAARSSCRTNTKVTPPGPTSTRPTSVLFATARLLLERTRPRSRRRTESPDLAESGARIFGLREPITLRRRGADRSFGVGDSLGGCRMVDGRTVRCSRWWGTSDVGWSASVQGRPRTDLQDSDLVALDAKDGTPVAKTDNPPTTGLPQRLNPKVLARLERLGLEDIEDPLELVLHAPR